MDYIYFELETSGSSPLYSRISSIHAAGLINGTFEVFNSDIDSLSRENLVLREFSDFAGKASHMAYPDEKALSFISSCFEQYCLYNPFSGLTPCAPSSDEIISAFGNEDFEKLMEDVRIEGELKHFYKDYKNYYYLPAEDTAVHKSVAQFVDKSVKTPASARTAYTKKAGTFIPASPYSVCPVFKTDYDDPRLYIPASDPDALTCLHLISHIPQGA